MCVAFLAINSLPGYRLLLASNRDEFYDRPSHPLHLWAGTDIYAGQDAKKGGTWLGCTRSGKWAIITNFRDPREFARQATTRGRLVSAFLAGNLSAQEFLESVLPEMHNYNGFNLIAGDPKGCFYLSNRKETVENISSGFYGLSNALLDAPWPKIKKGKRLFQTIVQKNPNNKEALFSLLLDESKAPDSELPKTGIPLERERLLSSLFIRSPIYGTKSSSILSITKSGEIEMAERVWKVPSETHPPEYQETSIHFP